MTAEAAVRHSALSFVKRDRVQEVEAFVQDVLVPLVQRARPRLADHWQLLRPDGGPSDDGTVVFATLFFGESTLAEWDLEALFSFSGELPIS